MIHLGTIELYTKKLKLRRFKENDDFLMFNNWTSDFEVAKYTSWHAHSSIKETQQFLQYLLNSYQKKDSYNWAIEFSGELIGSINVCYVDDEKEICGIAYCLSRKYWNQGYMTEALEEIIKFLFLKVNCYEIIAGTDSSNQASWKVLEKAGMKRVAHLKDIINRKDGTLGDNYQYHITKDEYNK